MDVKRVKELVTAFNDLAQADLSTEEIIKEVAFFSGATVDEVVMALEIDAVESDGIEYD